jgi:hypothetical protein
MLSLVDVEGKDNGQKCSTDLLFVFVCGKDADVVELVDTQDLKS